jgi:hypothetical protein
MTSLLTDRRSSSRNFANRSWSLSAMPMCRSASRRCSRVRRTSAPSPEGAKDAVSIRSSQTRTRMADLRLEGGRLLVREQRMPGRRVSVLALELLEEVGHHCPAVRRGGCREPKPPEVAHASRRSWGVRGGSCSTA